MRPWNALPILPTLATVLAVTCLSRKNRLEGVGSSAWGCGTGQLSPCRRTGSTPNIVRRGMSWSRGCCCRFLSPLLSLLCLPLACQPWPASPPSPWLSWCCCSSQAAAAPALPGSSCPSLQGHWNPRLAPQTALRGRHLQLHGLRLQSDSVCSPPPPLPASADCSLSPPRPRALPPAPPLQAARRASPPLARVSAAAARGLPAAPLTALSPRLAQR